MDFFAKKFKKVKLEEMDMRIRSCILILALVLSMIAGNMQTVQVVKASTATQTQTDENLPEKVIIATGIMDTDSKGNMNTNKKVTRAQFSKILVNASPLKDTVAKKIKTSLFSDVKSSFWAAPYIKIAIEQDFMQGNLQGKFRPQDTITLKEAVNGVVRLLGYEDSDFKGNKTSAKMSFYYSNHLNKGISKKQNEGLTRGDVVNLIYNTLTTKTKTGTVYGETLGYPLNKKGDIDYLALIDNKMKGPIVATKDWTKKIPFSVKSAVIYRDNKKVTSSSIQVDDVLYYSKELKTVWAYKDKVTGEYQKATPDRINPETVTVGGKEYTIGTQKSAYALSTMGEFEYGDRITLLLGKDNTVVGVKAVEDKNEIIGGIIIEKGKHENSKKDEGATVTNYIRMVDSKGVEHTFDCDTDKLLVGKPVQVSYIDDKAVVNEVELYDISGKVDDEATSLGSHKFAEDANILDYREGAYKQIKAKDLAGLYLYQGEIKYYRLNKDGAITDLIVGDVTGELYDYGILISASESGNAYMASGSYTFEIDGKIQSATTSYKMLVDNEKGPARFQFDEKGQLAGIRMLSVYEVRSISETEVSDSRDSKEIADNAVVYLVKDGSYYSTTLSKISNLERYKVNAYYDSNAKRKDVVRVIVAREKTENER